MAEDPKATILDRIVLQRRHDLAVARAGRDANDLRHVAESQPAAIGFAQRLRASGSMAVIAEVKRASPSKGDIAPDINAAEQPLAYARGGAAAISILTEPTWFKGSLDDMREARAALAEMGAARPAILRKDFIVDEYQVLEARAYGADALLLIVASLTEPELQRLLAFTHEMGMEAMVEVNNAEEMGRAADAGAAVIGINNRDLRIFNVDLGTTDRLASLVPAGTLLAALSGMSKREDVVRFAAAGAEAVLVGEALMVDGDPAAKIRELLGC